jgi:hypothetical protein
MTLQIELPPDVEERYAAEASAKGVSLERHVRERLIENAPSAGAYGVQPIRPRPLNLPAMKGTVIGSLHRRDIYDERG